MCGALWSAAPPLAIPVRRTPGRRRARGESPGRWVGWVGLGVPPGAGFCSGGRLPGAPLGWRATGALRDHSAAIARQDGRPDGRRPAAPACRRPARPLLQLGGEAPDPAAERGMADVDAAVGEHVLVVAAAGRASPVPARRPGTAPGGRRKPRKARASVVGSALGSGSGGSAAPARPPTATQRDGTRSGPRVAGGATAGTESGISPGVIIHGTLHRGLRRRRGPD
jgi:hypothetical protein